MFSTVILPWIHYVAIITLSGAIFAKLYLMKLPASADIVRLLPRIDRLEGTSAVIVFITGLARVWHGAKPAEFYWQNGLFHGVVGLFVLAALVSLIPTVRFVRWKRALDASGAMPEAAALRKTRVFSHVMATVVVVIALMITLVAKGYGGH